MKQQEFEERRKRGELEARQNYIECINPECDQIVPRYNAIELSQPTDDNYSLLAEKKGFGNIQVKKTNLVSTQVCSKKCGYYMSKNEEQDELNTCDNDRCHNSLRMDEINHDTSPEEAKKIHEEMGHIVQDRTTYYCSQECAVADQL